MEFWFVKLYHELQVFIGGIILSEIYANFFGGKNNLFDGWWFFFSGFVKQLRRYECIRSIKYCFCMRHTHTHNWFVPKIYESNLFHFIFFQSLAGMCCLAVLIVYHMPSVTFGYYSCFFFLVILAVCVQIERICKEWVNTPMCQHPVIIIFNIVVVVLMTDPCRYCNPHKIQQKNHFFRRIFVCLCLCVWKIHLPAL